MYECCLSFMLIASTTQYCDGHVVGDYWTVGSDFMLAMVAIMAGLVMSATMVVIS